MPASASGASTARLSEPRSQASIPAAGGELLADVKDSGSEVEDGIDVISSMEESTKNKGPAVIVKVGLLVQTYFLK